MGESDVAPENAAVTGQAPQAHWLFFYQLRAPFTPSVGGQGPHPGGQGARYGRKRGQEGGGEGTEEAGGPKPEEVRDANDNVPV